MGIPRTRSVEGVRGPGVSVFGLPLEEVLKLSQRFSLLLAGWRVLRPRDLIQPIVLLG